MYISLEINLYKQHKLSLFPSSNKENKKRNTLWRQDVRGSPGKGCSTKKSLFMAVFVVYIIWIGLSIGFAAAKESVPGLFVFGDSLVDAGNNNHLVTFAKGDYPHNGIDFPAKKPTGRFSNGKIAADLLAEKLGLPPPPPYLELKKKGNYSAIFTGVSFASGAAGIFSSTGNVFGQRIILSQQIQDFITVHEELVNQLQSSAAYNHLSKSIFMLVIGSVDFYEYIALSNLKMKNNPQHYTNLMVTNLKEQLKMLFDYDMRKLLVVGVAQIGCTPFIRAKNTTQGCNEEVNLWVTMFNEALKAMLAQLRQELHGSFNYSYFDSYKAMQDIYADSAAYGFTDVKSACCGSGKLNADLPCFPYSNICPNRTEHFFWDLFGHLTEATSRVFVDQMFNRLSHYSFPFNVEGLISI